MERPEKRSKVERVLKSQRSERTITSVAQMTANRMTTNDSKANDSRGFRVERLRSEAES